jgi:hypothetical protein
MKPLQKYLFFFCFLAGLTTSSSSNQDDTPLIDADSRLRKTGSFSPLVKTLKIGVSEELLLEEFPGKDGNKLQDIKINTKTGAKVIYRQTLQPGLFVFSATISSCGNYAVMIIYESSGWYAEFNSVIAVAKNENKWTEERLKFSPGWKSANGDSMWIEEVSSVQKWPVMECVFCRVDKKSGKVVRNEGFVDLVSMSVSAYGENPEWIIIKPQEIVDSDYTLIICPSKSMAILSADSKTEYSTLSQKNELYFILANLTIAGKDCRYKITKAGGLILPNKHISDVLNAIFEGRVIRLTQYSK